MINININSLDESRFVHVILRNIIVLHLCIVLKFYGTLHMIWHMMFLIDSYKYLQCKEKIMNVNNGRLVECVDSYTKSVIKLHCITLMPVCRMNKAIEVCFFLSKI